MLTPNANYFSYIPIRPRDVQWGLYVTGAGCTEIPPGSQPYPPDTHPECYFFRWETGRTLPEYQAIYITHGEGIFESTPTGLLDISAGSVILLFPGVWHRYRPRPETGWKEYWVSFNGEVMDRLVERGYFSSQRAVLLTGLNDEILTPYKQLIERLHVGAMGFPHLIAADTMEILAAVLARVEEESVEMIAQGPQEVVTVNDRMVAEAIRLIWQQSQGPMTVDSLTRQLPTTRRSLERRFSAAIGHGIHDEIVHCRLERAKRLLVATDLSMKEIAAAAGFSGADSMGRTFGRIEGISPLQFRRQRPARQGS